MDMKEKLVVLLESVPMPELLYGQPLIGVCRVADHLIANGVTVQEWISVKDRLPDEDESSWAKLYGTKSWVPGMFRKWSNTVIACVERMDGRKRVIALDTIDGKWDWHKMQDDEQVICWMPLPEPPKGE